MSNKQVSDSRINAINKEISQTNQLLTDGKLHTALDEAHRIIQAYPGFGACHRLLGATLLEFGKKEAANACFRRALELDPSDASRRLLARGLVEIGDHQEALSVLATMHEPDTATSRALRIEALAGSGRREEAETLTIKTLDERRESPSLLVAVAGYGLALDYPNLVSRLSPLLELKENSPSLTAKLKFCIGDILHQQGEHAAAFHAFGDGNRLARSASHRTPFNPDSYRKRVHSITKNFPLKVLQQDPSITPRASMSRLLMIIGAPRSGKTLLESLLTCHPEIRAGREQIPFETLLGQVEQQTGQDRNHLLATLPLETRLKSAGPYQRTLQQQGAGVHFVTDTNPANLAALGYMWASIPESRFIFVDRDPLDLGFSNYATHMPHIGTGQLGLEDLGIYLGEVQRLSAFWQKAFGDRAMRVSYEAITGDEAESVIQACLAFLGLDWHPDCALANQAPTRTTVAGDAMAGHRPDDRFIGIAKPYREWLTPMQESMRQVLSETEMDP
ncbi:tetratricopeptide (TPR) repeat protein [Natronospira proteinivora]|uniref:Tetratricopeptide (TPR) repeat protein n=1 Tax=Natronospira proteinivora TaxID=1807133 RepID=A0ABT1G559_9GAMM|nr:tetratricopeptide repeat-containing sulfotransferase family protein [Natronospira proteinivora]MCP1726431.1 tetratricopeptide (TPR) repeat protein [Natronospira proteinivora]